ncbi:polymerase histidinol phosphatase-like [Fusarium sp. NRRL 52700]|nr:polymerase histidinol phosphatase-like [Fusarium sp. NRRL 52700]
MLSEEGDYVLSGSILGESGVIVGSATDYLAIDASILVPRVFFADLHARAPTRPFITLYVQKIAGLDVVGYKGNYLNITQERWSQTLDIIKSTSSEGEFGVFTGTEWRENSAAGGDHNVVFLDDLHTSPLKFPFDRHGNVIRSSGAVE